MIDTAGVKRASFFVAYFRSSPRSR